MYRNIVLRCNDVYVSYFKYLGVVSDFVCFEIVLIEKIIIMCRGDVMCVYYFFSFGLGLLDNRC